MLKRKTMFLAIAMLSSVFCLRASSIYPYLVSRNYLGNFATPQGSLITASSPALGQILTQSGVNPTPSGPTGVWGLNQRKGNGGYYYQNINNNFSTGRLAMQSNGSFGVLGVTYAGGYSVILESFSVNGVLQWTWTVPGFTQPDGIVSDGSGGYYICGQNYSPQGGWLMHVTSEGFSDPSFNGGSPLIFPKTGTPTYAYFSGVGVQSTGKVVVTGSTGIADFTVGRILPNGTTDADFASSTGAPGTPSALGIDSQDRILVTTWDGGAVMAKRIYRFLANGGLDTSFGGVTTPGYLDLPNNTAPLGLLVLSDNSAIIVGYDNGFTPKKMRVTKVTAAGLLDTTFGGLDITTGKKLGYVIIDYLVTSRGDNLAYGAALMPNGDIAVVGQVLNGAMSVVSYYGIAMLKSDGTLDPSFTIPGGTPGAVAGSVIVQLGSGNSAAYGVGYQNVAGSTGLVVAGWGGAPTSYTGSGLGVGLVFYTNNN